MARPGQSSEDADILDLLDDVRDELVRQVEEWEFELRVPRREFVESLHHSESEVHHAVWLYDFAGRGLRHGGRQRL